MLILPLEPFLKVMQGAIREGDRDEKAPVAINEERENSPSLFLPQGSETEIPAPIASTTVSSGPYAGLRSARKRVHDETVDSGEKQTPSFGPAKKTVKKGSVLKNVHVINSRPMEEGPDWYANVDPRQQPARKDLHDLTFFFTLVANLKSDAEDPEKNTTTAMTNVRERLQHMEFFITLSHITVKKSGLLGHEGLPKIIEDRVPGVHFPVYIRSDADLLYRKWMSGQIDPHLLRGIVTKKGTGKEERTFKSYSIDPTFPGKVSCNYAGAGNLVVGQWWPLQLCAKRDGAHGEIEAGIHGQKDHGAYSVVVSGGGYANVDNGDTIKYCGTQGTESSPSASTNLMLKAYNAQQSLRVLRSSSLPSDNTYRPAQGIRYDGQYLITGYEVLDNKTKMYRFLLSRVEGQDPIRYTGDGMIPSHWQINELVKVRGEVK